MMETEVEMPIYDGEASETDSEENLQIASYDNHVPLSVVNKVQCLEITGEDAESDSDDKESVSSCNTATTLTTVSEQIGGKTNNTKSQSLLHHKLRESNNLFYNDLEDVIKEFLRDNEKALTDTDNHITKTQTILQGATPSLRNFHHQSIILRNKLETLLTSNFLMNVKIFE